MNFHISNLSPLRPKFSSSNLSPNHDTTPSSPVKIAFQPAEDSSDASLDSTDDSLSDSSADDVTQDSRDVLVQRLTDLAERLGANVRTATIEALHKQVDEMERVLLRQNGSGGGASRGRSVGSRRSGSRRASASLRPGAARPRSLGQLVTGQSGGEGSSLGVMAPMSPSWLMSHFQRRPSVHEEKKPELHKEKQLEVEIDEPVQPGKLQQVASREAPRAPSLKATELPLTLSERPSMNRLFSLDASTTSPRISSQLAEDAIKEAEALCAEMATVIESLQTRREESDHLQTVLVQREAVAHQHLLAAAREHAEVVADNEAELRHLRLELRALEVQCWGYVPEGADPKLDESIRNWKEDWRALREKFAVRKGSSFVLGDDSSTT